MWNLFQSNPTIFLFNLVKIEICPFGLCFCCLSVAGRERNRRILEEFYLQAVKFL